MDQIDVFKNYLYSMGPYAKKKSWETSVQEM